MLRCNELLRYAGRTLLCGTTRHGASLLRANSCFSCAFRGAVVMAALASAAPAWAQAFQTLAPYAILMDAETRTILMEKAADELVSPASTAKLMTAEIVFHEIAEGRLKLADEFTISRNALREGGARAGGSSMFALVDSRVSIENLIQGLVVQSGNDAAIALAEGIAGSEAAFATLMNRRASELGMAKSTFANPWGKADPAQKVTAREMAMLADHVIRTYPELYKYFGEKEFTWNKIKQQNRNPLLFMDIGADGLKTGNVEDSGFGLIGSAVQNGQRLIVVVNGLKSAKDRAEESRKILQWGFRAFEPKILFGAGEIIGSARLYGGAQAEVDLLAEGAVKVLLPRGSGERLSARIVYTGPIAAPVAQGANIARLQVLRGTVQALDMPLKAAVSVGIGPLPRRAYDAALELATGLFRRNFGKK